MEYKRIAIIKLSALGDIIHTIPAFHILRKHFPRSIITWFAEPVGAKLLKNFEGIDEIVSINLKTGTILDKYKEVRRILSEYDREHRPIDLIIDFQGLWKSAIFAWVLKRKSGSDTHIAGFGKKNLRESQARFFYTFHAPYFEETEHVIFKNIHLVESICKEETSPTRENSFPQLQLPEVVFPLKPSVINEIIPKLASFLEANRLEDKRYIIINIGGGWETKLLEDHQVIELIQGIKNRYPVVILWGNEPERRRALRIGEETGVPITGFLDFSELIALIYHSRLIVTADTLALHLADAVQKKSIGIFGPTSPRRNGSLLEKSVSIYEKTDCGFCYKKKCGTITCIKKIRIERIIEEIDKEEGI